MTTKTAATKPAAKRVAGSESLESESLKDVAYYLSLPYAVEITRTPEEDGGGYCACVPVLGRWSAVGDGETPEEAYADLRAAMPSLLEGWLTRGVAIPEPASDLDPPLLSGKISLRIPRTLHTQAALVAEKEGVSINQLISVAVAREVGGRRL